MVLFAVLTVMVATLAACGDDGGVEVADPWARASAQTQDAGAVYMTISSSEGDNLVGVAVDPSVAAKAELHETTMAEDGLMSMSQVTAIPVPTGGEVKLEPGGYHVMLMKLAEPLVDGNEITVTLTFETAGDMEVKATVEENR